ncbi:MAG TPA: hypothetical protein VGE27_03545 [Gemmatimonas sp.]|uniref:hypothetical protein n=1 Tax=Gemmatimonas sp. TaxID=1962908 RepID=UPI002ED9785A
MAATRTQEKGMNLRKRFSQFSRLLLLATLTACQEDCADEMAAPKATALTMAASPNEQRLAQGATTLFTVTVVRTSFTGPVTLSAPSSGLPAGVTVDFDPQTLPAGVFQSTMRVSVSPTAPVQYVADPPRVSIPIVATAEGLTANAAPQVQIVPSTLAGITINATPSSFSLLAGQSADALVTVARQGNYSGPVTLTMTPQSAGMTSTLTPVSGVPDTWRVRVTASDPDGLRLLYSQLMGGVPIEYVLRATPQGIAPIETKLNVLVVFPFYFPTPERDARVVVGGQDAVRVALARSTGLTAPITMVVDSAPTGISGTFAPNPAVDDITTLTVRAAATVTPGDYQIRLKSTPPTGLGLTEHQVRMKVVVVAPPPIQPPCVFSMSGLTVVAGNTVSGTLSVARAADFTGAVSVAVGPAAGGGIPTGMSFTFGQSPLQQATTTLQVTTTTATPPGSYALQVNGTSFNGACTSGAFTVVVSPAVAPPPPPPPTSAVTRIVIEPANAEITAPATQQYTARLYDANGAVMPAETGGVIEYSASNGTPSNNVATINPTTGLATGVSAGTITITARYVRNGVQVVQDATPLLVYAAGTSGHYGSATMSTNGNVRTVARGDSVLFQIIVRNTAGTVVTSGVNPEPTVSSSNPGAISVRPTTGPVPGYFFWMKAAPGATLNTEVRIRYDVNGAGGELLIRVSP